MTGLPGLHGGATGLWSLEPDLLTFGKVLGGGSPAAAGAAGRAARRHPRGPMYQAGTLSGNPLATAAGLATLSLLDDDAYWRLDGWAVALCDGLRDAFAAPASRPGPARRQPVQRVHDRRRGRRLRRRPGPGHGRLRSLLPRHAGPASTCPRAPSRPGSCRSCTPTPRSPGPGRRLEAQPAPQHPSPRTGSRRARGPGGPRRRSRGGADLERRADLGRAQRALEPVQPQHQLPGRRAGPRHRPPVDHVDVHAPPDGVVGHPGGALDEAGVAGAQAAEADRVPLGDDRQQGLDAQVEAARGQVGPGSQPGWLAGDALSATRARTNGSLDGTAPAPSRCSGRPGSRPRARTSRRCCSA